MDPIIREALEDLLQIRALSEIRPVQVQAWQAAARTLLGAAEKGVAGSDAPSPVLPIPGPKPTRPRSSPAAPVAEDDHA